MNNVLCTFNSGRAYTELLLLKLSKLIDKIIILLVLKTSSD